MLYNICYWWFFLSRGNRWTKYLANPKIRKPKSCLLMFASLVALDCFHLLLSTQLIADLTPEWSGGPMFHPLSHIYAKTLFLMLKQLQTMLWIVDALLFLIVSKRGTHFEHFFLIDKCSCKMVNTLGSDIFNSYVISHNFNLRSAKMSLWSFLVFSMTTAELRQPERSTSYVFVRLYMKSAYHLLTIVSDRAESKKHLLSHCFAWTAFFTIRKQCFINTQNLSFSIVLKICNISFT